MALSSAPQPPPPEPGAPAPASHHHRATSTTVACTLTTKEAAAQVNSWDRVRKQARSTTPLHNGVRLTFPAAMADELSTLAATEASCCAFLAIEVTTAGGTTSITITTEAADGLAIINRITGLSETEDTP